MAYKKLGGSLTCDHLALLQYILCNACISLFFYFSDKFAPLRLIKRAIGIFMKNKRCVNSNHEYALIILQHTAHWVK